MHGLSPCQRSRRRPILHLCIGRKIYKSSPGRGGPVCPPAGEQAYGDVEPAPYSIRRGGLKPALRLAKGHPCAGGGSGRRRTPLTWQAQRHFFQTSRCIYNHSGCVTGAAQPTRWRIEPSLPCLVLHLTPACSRHRIVFRRCSSGALAVSSRVMKCAGSGSATRLVAASE